VKKSQGLQKKMVINKPIVLFSPEAVQLTYRKPKSIMKNSYCDKMKAHLVASASSEGRPVEEVFVFCSDDFTFSSTDGMENSVIGVPTPRV